MVGYQLDDEQNLFLGKGGNHHFHPFKTGCLEFQSHLFFQLGQFAQCEF